MCVMSNKLNRSARRAMNRMDTKSFERATDLTMVRFLAIPCMILAKDYGWDAEKVGTFIGQINDLYSEEHDIEYYRDWLWNNVGVTLDINRSN